MSEKKGPSFSLPTIYSSPDGWGPPNTELVGELGFALAPINKAEEREKREKFGYKPADWSGTGFTGGRYPQRTYQSKGEAAPSAFGSLRDLDEDSGFTFVDRSQPVQKFLPRYRNMRGRGRDGRGRFGGWGGRGGAGGRGSGAPRTGQGRKGQQPQRQGKWKQNKANDWARERRTFVHRSASVEVRPTWKVVGQFSLVDLAKMESSPPGVAEDLKVCGQLEGYDPNCDKVGLKTPISLGNYAHKAFYSPTTSEDPIIRDIAMEEQTGDEPHHRVFGTDTIIAAIMSATRSVNSWDLSVEVFDIDGGKVVFLDKRDEFDLLPVNETSRDAPQGELATTLAEELALVNQKFTQTILKKPQGNSKPQLVRVPGSKGPNPFAEPNDDVASALYKYRSWKLAPNVSLVARCQVDGAVSQGGKVQLYKAYALNEYDQKLTDWRKKLEKTSGGGVLANEIKNNSCTLAKWTAQALLVGADQMKLGYVARTNQSSRFDHQILQLLNYSPVDFAKQIALNTRNMWAIAKNVVETITKLPEGNYCLLRDPNKAMLHLYAVPQEANDSDKEDEEEEEN
eukprot:TRINITY_DN16598_c0_g1_i1.p1 TRINITY_DN16598_c0_g1~~TRINITY_DN16598_c0_g1_i1.p1  ORF type:complete len:586 (-),score=98.88 TRINITY_DN16598_c0_g1_i1:235-1935(-)